MADMKKTIDRPVARLVLDLEERGLLDRTLIVLARVNSAATHCWRANPTSLSRIKSTSPTRLKDLKFYGMHRHFTDAGSVLMFGGGIKRGHLHGLTADERPCKTIKDRVVIEDLHASIYHALGISPKLSYEIEKRAVLCDSATG